MRVFLSIIFCCVATSGWAQTPVPDPTILDSPEYFPRDKVPEVNRFGRDWPVLYLNVYLEGVGVVSPTGEEILPPIYKDISRVGAYHFIVQEASGQVKLLDRDLIALNWKQAIRLLTRIRKFPDVDELMMVPLAGYRKLIIRDSLDNVIGSTFGYRLVDNPDGKIVAYDATKDSTDFFDKSDFTLIKRLPGQAASIARGLRRPMYFQWTSGRRHGILWSDLSEVVPPEYRRAVVLSRLNPERIEVITEDKKYLQMDTMGELLFQTPSDVRPRDYVGSFFVTKPKGEWQIQAFDGRVIPTSKILSVRSGKLMYLGLGQEKELSFYGINTAEGATVIDTFGQQFFPMKYDSVLIFGYNSQRFVFLGKKNQWSLYDFIKERYFSKKITHWSFADDLPVGAETRTYTQGMLEHKKVYGDHRPWIVFWTRKGGCYLILEESDELLALEDYRERFGRTGPLPEMLERFISSRGKW